MAIAWLANQFSPQFGMFPQSGYNQTVSAVVRIKSKRHSSLIGKNEQQPESLRSIGIARLHHYYALIRLPIRFHNGYEFPL
jgi:hypothetical protein